MTSIATICEVSPHETVTWTMPQDTFDLVMSGMKGWTLAHGRRPAVRIDRILSLLETEGMMPRIREGVTRTVRPTREPVIRGRSADIIHYDDPIAIP